MLKTQIITLFQGNYKFLPQGPKEGWRGTWAFLGCLLLGQAEGDPSVQFNCSVMSGFVTPWTSGCQAFLSITNSWSLLKLMFIESTMPSKHLSLCCPLLLPSIFPSIRVFSSESVLRIRWLKYWNFRFSISPSNEYSGLMSFRMDWFDLLAVQRTLKSLL